MGDKPCNECKWFRGDVIPAQCANKNAVFFTATFARTQPISCGPSGRYWEPKEEKGNG